MGLQQWKMEFNPDSTKQATEVDILKKRINTFFLPVTKSIFGIHDPVGLRYLFQLRVGLSALRSHKFCHNFTDAPSL